MPLTLREKAQTLVERATVQAKKEEFGFKDTTELNIYLYEREALIEDMAKFIMDMTKEDGLGSDVEIAALKASIGELAKELKNMPKGDHEFNQDKFLADLGLGLAKVWKRDFVGAGEMGFIPNRYTQDDWYQYQKYQWLKDERSPHANKMGWLNKADLGSPIFQDTTTTGSYVVNPIYETELIRFAQEGSDMMDLVRTIPMFTRTHYFPRLTANSFSGGWHTGTSSTPDYAEAGTPTFGTRLE